MSLPPQKQAGMGRAALIKLAQATNAGSQMNRPLRITLIVAGILALLTLVLPLLVPLSVYRARLEGELSSAIGRPVRIEGPLTLTIFPDIGFRAERVLLTNSPGGQAPYLALVEKMRVAVKGAGLLKGKVDIAEILIERPDLRLEIDNKGQPNWLIKTHNHDGWLAEQTRFSGAEINISDGTIRYENFQANSRENLEDVDAIIGWFGSTIALDGAANSAGERISFVLKAVSPARLLNGLRSGVDISLTSDLVQASFKGNLTLNGPAQGIFKFDTPSLRKFSAWRGNGLPNVGGLEIFSLQTQLARHGTVYMMTDAKMSLGDSEIVGKVELETSQSTPLIRGMLKIDQLDVGSFLVAPDIVRSGRTDLWDSTQLNFVLLKRFQSDLKLEVQKLRIRSLEIQDAVIALSSHNSSLEARFDSFALHGGTGSMNVQLDAASPDPVYRAKIQFNRISTKPLWEELWGISGFEGPANLTLNINAQGDNPAAMMRSLSGLGSLHMINGRLHGIDLELAGRIARLDLQSAIYRKATTPFRQMRASFSISRGVLRTEDFGLTSPVYELLGSGTVDMAGRRLNLGFRPRARLEMDERPLNTIGDFSAPFSLTGTWARMAYKTAEPALGTSRP